MKTEQQCSVFFIKNERFYVNFSMKSSNLAKIDLRLILLYFIPDKKMS